MNFEEPHLKDRAANLPGGTLIDGKFELIEQVASGGMGFIYQAMHLETKRIVALKILRDLLRQDHRSSKRFSREARTVSRLFHPNTISILDYGTSSEGLMYIAMEWLEGMDLADWLDQRGPFCALDAAEIGVQIAQCLEEAHRKGIVHRDLKPENIFLVKGDIRRVKVLDFGIAKIVSGPVETQITQLGMVCGTPDFMSPEQARGEDLDGRSDIYGLGCVLYCLVTNRPPFVGSSPLKVVMQHLTEPFPSASNEIPPTFYEILRKAASKSREGRFPSAGEVVRALKTFIAVHHCSDDVGETMEFAELDEALHAVVARTAKPIQVEEEEAAAETIHMPELKAEEHSQPEGEGRTGEMTERIATMAASISSPNEATKNLPQTPISPQRYQTPIWHRLLLAAALLALVAASILLFMTVNTEDDAAPQKAEGREGATTPAPEEKEPTHARVSLHATPESMVFDAAGTPLGETPLEIAEVGKIEGVYRLEAEGYQPVDRWIRAKPGESLHIEVKLVPLSEINCAIKSVPSKATIESEGGEQLGVSPLLLKLREGEKMALKISKRGFKAEVVELEGKEPCEVGVQLKRK